jgi:hypothetical protein
MKIRPGEAELFHVNRRTDRQRDRRTEKQADRETDTTKLIIAFCSFAEASKSCGCNLRKIRDYRDEYDL